jgi:translocation and assembly module TamB
MRRAIIVTLSLIAAVLLLLDGAIVVLTRTSLGRERARQVILGALGGSIRGQLRIGGIEGTIAGRFALVDVAIADSQGRTFMTAERVYARMGLRSLLSKRIYLSELTFVRPIVRLTKAGDGTWNYARIFPVSRTAQKDTTGFGAWVEVDNVRVVDGTVLVREPWPAEARAVASADARARIEAVVGGGGGGGYERTMEFRSIEARFPTVILAHPDSDVVTVAVAQLSMMAAPVRPPEFDVRNLAGNVRVGRDTITLRRGELQLPTSRISGSMAYLVHQDETRLSLRGDTVAFADLRGLYPPLPVRGGGSLDLLATIRDSLPNEFVVTNARLTSGATRADGNLGLVVGRDTVRLHDTNVRLTSFSSTLLEQLVPGVEAPPAAAGAFTGRVEAKGRIDAMQVQADGRFAPTRHAPFHVFASGGVGFAKGIRADRLTLRADDIPMTYVNEFAGRVPFGGMLSGDATASGSSASKFTGRFAVTHQESGEVSRVTGEGWVAPADQWRMDVSMRLFPVSLELVQRFVPKVDLRGTLGGAARVVGTPRELEGHLALVLPEGNVDVDGTLNRSRAVASYDATARLRRVNLHTLAPAYPATQLNGTTRIVGSGFTLATMDARLTANLRDFTVDSTRFLEATMTARARDALLTVDTLDARTTFGSARATGTFGLTDRAEGLLAYTVAVDTLAGLQRWIATTNTGMSYPRPGIRARLARAAARVDSIREARQYDSVSIAVLAARRNARDRRRAIATQVPDVPPIARDSIAGAVHVTGELRGGIGRFTTRGTAVTSGIVWNGNAVGRGRVGFTVDGGGTPNAEFKADAGFDSLRTAGFAFDSTYVTGRYLNGAGNVEVVVFPGDTAEYRMRAEYAVHPEDSEVRLLDLSLRTDSTTWVSTRPSRFSWSGGGFAIDSLELRARPGDGRIFVNGAIPVVHAGGVDVAIDNLHVAPWLTVLQSNVPVSGVLTLQARVEGTRAAPRLRGTLSLAEPRLRNVPFPNISTTFSYDQRRLDVESDLRRATGAPLAHLRGSLPLDLALGGGVATRLVDGPLTVDVAGDSIPLGPLKEVTSALSSLDGWGRGAFGVSGTWKAPRVDGDVRVDLSRLGVAATGVTFTNASARLRMSGDSVHVDSLEARSGGTVSGGGSLILESLTHPFVDLRLRTTDARVLRNQHGELFATTRLALIGPIDSISVSGHVVVTRGIVYLPDPELLKVINTGDPILFAVVDSATARELDVSLESPVLRNMSMNVEMSVQRGTWARSRDANIEVYGDVGLRREPITGVLLLTGSLHTDHGEYTVYGKRFDVTRGTARFTGEPNLNPALQILATYEVRQAGRAPFNIRVAVGGSLRRPILTLDSDAQPTLSQSDLLSFLAFGRSSTSLLQFSGSGLEGGGQSGSSLAGNVGSLATRQLASVALGALVNEAKADLTRATRADVVDIVPADLPPDMSLGGLSTVLRGTEVQLGKYVDRRTFVLGNVRPARAVPGLSVERWFGTGSKLKTLLSYETRYQPQKPSLTSGLSPRTLQVLGALLTWSIGW